ncbi:DUF3379 domain-containing protein [Colwellia sp. MB3u-70]|uniref:DUF3379 family protein n=1 Tax=unclassified Colwellia TaxID=196834 RepID=UPI0015F66CC0|nr:MULTISPECIES: DUF3379 family protein [unclassified Colwellia]MBA6292599.1 DUF3379 domain-containing protein [Colwellia sp. MB3u-8]MBA6307394.1 DUF3379 domain-containing protein [Colwellia sp. MB3u-70]
MDDLKFRRSLLAEPNNRDDAINAAIKSDSAKQKFSQELDTLENKIAQAMHIPVPEDLAHKLILRQTFASHQQQKRKTRIRLSMAASVALVMGLTLNFMMFSSTYKNLGDYAIAHVNYEASHFSNNDQPKVTLASLNEKMATFKGSFDSTFGRLIFADYCRFDGTNSLHLVFQGQSSPVNIFILPDDEDIKFIANFANDKLQGRSLNFNHSNIIVVGDKKEPIKQWQERVSDHITWSI